MTKLPVYAVYTPSHEVLVRRFFLPSLPDDVHLRLHLYDIEGAGNFVDQGFLRTIRHKLELILASIRRNLGRVIVWSDVDIQFFSSFAPTVRQVMAGHDLGFQVEFPGTPQVNTGFVALKCSQPVSEFFEAVRSEVERTGQNEQPVVNDLLASGSTGGLRVGRFPLSFYAMTHGAASPNIVLHHANGTVPRDGKSSLELKIEQFEHVRGLLAGTLQPHEGPIAAHSDANAGSRGCVFFNFGTKCLNMLLVALYTLREHYDGPITVFLADVPDEDRLKEDLAPLELDFRSFSRADYIHSSLRAVIADRSPYESTLLFDSDLLFLSSPEPLWQPLHDAGLLVTRFFPNPFGVDGHPARPGFGSRIGHLNDIAHLVSPEDFARATARLHEGIDINVGVMGIVKGRATAFLDEFSRTIERGRSILLVDESLTNVLVPKYPHHVADETWNCPADEIHRRTPLGDAKIVHYFADGVVVNGRRLGRDPDTEAGKLWLAKFCEMQSRLPVARWRAYDPMPEVRGGLPLTSPQPSEAPVPTTSPPTRERAPRRRTPAWTVATYAMKRRRGRG